MRRIAHLEFYDASNPKMYLVDETSRVWLLTIDIGIILTKVRIE